MHYKYHHAELFKDVPAVDYKAFDNNIVIYGAGFQGLLAAHLLKQKNIGVICFADRDKEKQKSTYYGLPVISPEEMEEKYSDALIIVTPYVFDPVYKKYKEKFSNVILPVDLFLEFDIEGFDDLPDLPFWYRPKTFDYYINVFLRKCCNALTGIMLYSTEISVSQVCNLRCKHCTSLMPYYEKPKHFDYDKLVSYADKVCDNRIFHHIFVEGGEPFLWKPLGKFLKYLSEKSNVWLVIPITNGTVIPDKELIQMLKSPKIEVRISDYGKYSKVDELVKIFEEEHIRYKVQIQRWCELSAFSKEPFSDTVFRDVINECCKIGGRGSGYMADGKLFCCPIQANLHNTGIYKSQECDYVDLEKDDQDKIEKFLRTKHIPEICRHCNGRGYTNVAVPPAEQLKPGEKFKVTFK